LGRKGEEGRRGKKEARKEADDNDKTQKRRLKLTVTAITEKRYHIQYKSTISKAFRNRQAHGFDLQISSLPRAFLPLIESTHDRLQSRGRGK
jgi:hypothetical protein